MQGTSFSAFTTIWREKPKPAVPTHNETIGYKSEIIYYSSNLTNGKNKKRKWNYHVQAERITCGNVNIKTTCKHCTVYIVVQLGYGHNNGLFFTYAHWHGRETRLGQSIYLFV